MTEPNDTTNAEKKTNKYVKTFRSGAIAANIFVRQAASGFEYFDFGLSRAWKTTDGKEGYSQNFFVSNREALHTVIDQACQYIDEQNAAGDASTDQANAECEETPLT